LDTETTGALERPEDAGENPAGIVKRWMMELDLATKQEKPWRKHARAAIERYRDEEKREDAQFNILFSNVQTLSPSLYAKSPVPDVRRRYRDADPVGKEIAEVLERGASYTVDTQDFDGAMNIAVFDALLPGRGVTRIKHEMIDTGDSSTLTGDEDAGVESLPSPGAPPALADQLMQTTSLTPALPYYEEVRFEPVAWDDFRRGPGRRWDEVTWVAFRHRLTREQAEDINAELGKTIGLDYIPEGADETDGDDSDTFKRLTVWEIWDKDERRVIWIAPNHKDAPFFEEDDPLSLRDFFPIPRPLYAIEDSSSLIPINEYRIYKDQAEELDRITLRITKIIEVLKVRGIANSAIAEMWEIEDAEDGDFAPAENIEAILEGGGLEKAIWMFPTEKIVVVLRELYMQRDQIKQTIYEIMGISDILRGNSKASETATAQNIKAQWGSLRLDKRQKEVQRYARDLIRLSVEVMAERFSPTMLSLMTGKQVTPEMQEIMQQDGLRSYRIDIETDSTIASDAEADKQNITQLFTGIGGFIQSIGPAVDSGYLSMEAAKAMLLAGVRRFKLGRDVEDAIDNIGGEGEEGQQQEPEGPTPEQMQAQQAQQAEMAQFQAEQESQRQEFQLKASEQQAKSQESMAKLENDIQQHRSEMTMKMQQFEAQLEEQRRQHDDKMAVEWAKLGQAREQAAQQAYTAPQ